MRADASTCTARFAEPSAGDMMKQTRLSSKQDNARSVEPRSASAVSRCTPPVLCGTLYPDSLHDHPLGSGDSIQCRSAPAPWVR